MNSEWHAANKMPSHPTLEQQLKWHAEHAKECGCRPMPTKLLAKSKKTKSK